MTIHVFRSTDTGAPTLSGTAGDLTNLLDKLLVDGYNSKTITITQAAGVATATCTSHGFNALQTVVISGAGESEYNIVVRVSTVPNANTFTFPVDAGAATPATGTITCKVAPLGWTLSYTATNKRAWRQKSGTNQLYVRVDDTGTGSAAYARVVGYETMSDVDTGTNAFPTSGQFSGGMYWHKSSAASGTTRAWMAFSDGAMLYLVNQHDGTDFIGVAFGDITTYVAGDAYHTILIAHTGTSGGSSFDGQRLFNTCASALATGQSGNYIARIYTQASGAATFSKVVPYSAVLGANSVSPMGSGNGLSLTYPSPAAGGLLTGRVVAWEPTIAHGPRGRLPGLWVPGHVRPLTHADTFTGASGTDIAGRTFIVISPLEDSGGNTGQAFFETSDTWD